MGRPVPNVPQSCLKQPASFKSPSSPLNSPLWCSWPKPFFFLPFFPHFTRAFSKTAFSSGAPRQGSAMNADKPHP
jgi:hypothetical protein